MADVHDQDSAITRQRFIGATAASAGALALGRLPVPGIPARQYHAGGPPAARAGDFVTAFDHNPPFSFVYDGVPSTALLAQWSRLHQHSALDAARTQHTLTWSAPGDGLVVRCVLVEYHDFPTVDWTISYRNTSARTAPPLSDLLALDVTLQRRPTGEFLVHTCNGSGAVPDDYGLQEIPLLPRAAMLFTCNGGRPLSGYFRAEPGLSRAGFPYYNIDWGGEGAIVAIGWPGQWAAEMTRDAGVGLHLEAGMSTTDGPLLASGDHIRDTGLADLTLQPGEEIRTLRIVLQFWQEADWIAAQNLWRRWMRTHNMPRPGGRPVAPMCPVQSAFYGSGMLGCSADSDLQTIDALAAQYLARATGGVIDHWWMDAGWYQVPPDATDWTWTGTWTPDPTRYPHGLRPVTNEARARGLQAIVWHEPERVRPGTWLYTQHPEWLLGPGPDGDALLLDLGNPHAWNWLVAHFDGLIRQQGVDVYRQDFNIDPLAYWNMADPPARRGITQIRHVTGLLAFWDELRRRHPNLLIDCCASGGRRNELECMQRAVPLWRSDDNGGALDEQCHTYGIAFWLPYYGSGIAPSDVYTLRSGMLPSYLVFLQALTGMAGTQHLAQRMLDEWRACAADLLGDYYPLTPYSLDSDVWMAWQFNSPEAGTGVVQVFRRDDSTITAMRLTLRGLDAGATYELRNFDLAGVMHATGHTLMISGLAVTLAAAPAAATITYRQVGPA